jgi:hypothetical protein
VVDDVLIRREVIAVPRPYPGSSRVSHGIPDKTQMVTALTKESVTGIAPPIKVQSSEF